MKRLSIGSLIAIAMIAMIFSFNDAISQVPRIAWNGPLGDWKTTNGVWANSGYFYPQLAQMKGTASVDQYYRPWFQSDTTLRNVLARDTVKLKLWAIQGGMYVPKTWRSDSTETTWAMNVQNAMYLLDLEDEPWDNGRDYWDNPPEWFKFDPIPVTNNAAGFDQNQTYIQCNTATNVSGLVFDDTVKANVLRYQNCYAVEIEVQRTSGPADATPMLRLTVDDLGPRGRLNGVDPDSIHAELIVRGQNVPMDGDWHWVGLKFWDWDSTALHPTRAWYFKGSGSTKISLFNYDSISFRVKKMHIYDVNAYLLRYHANKQQYWNSLNVRFCGSSLFGVGNAE